MRPNPEPTRSWGAFLVAMVAAAVFAPTLLNGFAYDDVALILIDTRVRTLGSIGEILGNGYWGDPALGLYRPLTTLSFAIDWSLGSGAPAWFHLTNTLLHAGTTALVFLLLARWFAIRAALAGGLLFAVHPVHVEAVANVVGRAELLAALAVLAAILLWLYRPADRVRVVRTAGVALLLALGLAAKESAIVLLPLLALADVAEGSLDVRRPWPWLRANAGAFAALVIVIAAWIAVRIAVLGTMAPSRVDAAFDLATEPGARISTALQAWPVWVNLLFAPVTLLADYGPRVLLPITRPNAPALLGAVMLAALVVGGSAAVVRRAGRAALVLLWFPATILPVSNLIVPTGVIVAERTLYLPSVAVSIALAALANRLAHASPQRTLVPRSAVLAFSLLLGMLMGRSLVRIPAWRSTEDLFAAQVADRPDSFRAQWYLARAARERGNLEEAARRYDLALILWPYRQRLNIEAASFAIDTGRLERARDIARHAVAIEPANLAALRMLAGTALDLGDTLTARRTVTQALRLSPDDDVLRRMADALRIETETQ